MNSKRDQFFLGIATFFTFLIAYKILKRAINVGTTIFLILVVFLMIYLLNHM